MKITVDFSRKAVVSRVSSVRQYIKGNASPVSERVGFLLALIAAVSHSTTPLVTLIISSAVGLAAGLFCFTAISDENGSHPAPERNREGY